MKAKVLLAAAIAALLTNAAFADTYYYRMRTGSIGEPLNVVSVSGSQPSQHSMIGLPYTAKFTAAGGDGHYTWSLSGSLPPGLVFANGMISGTLQGAGSYSGLMVTVHDGRGKVVSSEPFSIDVDPATANVALATPAVIRQGATISGTLTSNLTSPQWDVTVIPTPSNAPVPEIVASNGTFSVQAPNVTQATTYAITSHASKNGISADSTAVTVKVMPPPSISMTTTYSGTSGIAMSTATPTVNNRIGTVSWSISGTLPSGLSGPSATGVISGTPTAAQTRTVSLIATDSDGATASTTLSFEITAEVVKTVSANAANLSLSSLFTPSDWQAATPKRVIISSGAVVYSTNTSTAALMSGTGWGGTLTLQINSGAEIQGAGGIGSLTSNIAGTPGGDAIAVQKAGLVIQNSGAIRAGGGGGGYGGSSGDRTAVTVTEPASGLYAIYTGNWYGCFRFQNTGMTQLYWNGTPLYSGNGYQPNMSIGGYTCGAVGEVTVSSNVTMIGGVKRTTTQTILGTSGGAGGKGQGHNQLSTTGGAGKVNSVGSQQGYQSGAGGNGGGWGLAGSAGGTGVSGVAGSAGGLAGYAINGSASYSGSGTRLGR